MKTYRDVQVTHPGVLERVERPVPVPGQGEVPIEVETLPLERADEAFRSAMSGDAKVRMVLTTP